MSEVAQNIGWAVIFSFVGGLVGVAATVAGGLVGVGAMAAVGLAGAGA